MRIKNSFVQESFVWNGHSDNDFKDSAIRLFDIVAYLRSLDEPIYCQDDLYSKKILLDTPIYGLFERDEQDPLYDAKQMVLLSLQGMSYEDDETFDDQIGLQFYAIDNPEGEPVRQVTDLTQYLFQRRDILIGCAICQEFSSFMRTCFPDIIFAEDIEKGIRGIPNFGQSSVREEIVHDLGVLNDEALSIYEKHHPLVKEMFDELSAKGVDCSPDKSKNRKYLTFSFSYSLDSGESQVKPVFCSPHTKLISKNSNLSILPLKINPEVGIFAD